MAEGVGMIAEVAHDLEQALLNRRGARQGNRLRAHETQACPSEGGVVLCGRP